MKKQEDKRDIQNLLQIMARLRDPAAGCPWDLEQTFESIAPYTIEEAYEVADAIERGAAPAELADELGDLLLQVVYHARMAEEAGLFDFGDVVARICDKMTRRHPHVFGDETVADAAAQTRAWEQIKAAEREDAGRTGNASAVLAGVPVALPALKRAAKLGRRAARVGFDWPDRAGPREKIDEELAELDGALARGDAEAAAGEIGDVLFAVANLSRHVGADPESSLRGTNARFEARFARVEAAVAESGRDWADFSLDELEAFWQRAKAAESDLL